MNPGALMAKPLCRQPRMLSVHVMGSVRPTPAYSRKVPSVRPPVDTVGIVVPSGLFGRVQVRHAVVPAANDKVVGDHRAGDAREQHTVRAKVAAESRARLVQQPWVHGEADDRRDVATTPDVDDCMSARVAWR